MTDLCSLTLCILIFGQALYENLFICFYFQGEIGNVIGGNAAEIKVTVCFTVLCKICICLYCTLDEVQNV